MIEVSNGWAWMKKYLPALPEPVIRLGLVFICFFGIVLFIRIVIIPPRLKETGPQRTSAIERELSREISYVGSNICEDCHDEEYVLKRKGYHKYLSCETCHGPAKDHTEDPEILPSAPRERDFCPQCHAYNLSRPTGFPQIFPVAHNPLDPCFKCHDPHDPKPPEVPKECAACHAQIERTKAVSPHIFLECTTCHITPDGHKINPDQNRPTKPEKREFCAQCHGLESSVKETPKIDLLTHGEDYLCWQCHYPHMPEIQ